MILISLGSNKTGIWGNPHQTLEKAMSEIEKSGLSITHKTPIIETEPFGGNSKGSYANALIATNTFCPPHALLRRLKFIEHKAGRLEARYASVLGRLPRWRDRVLDLDIIDWRGVIYGPQNRALRQGYVPLTLPHNSLYERAYISDLLPQLEAL